jgi:hypothetical protein
MSRKKLTHEEAVGRLLAGNAVSLSHREADTTRYVRGDDGTLIFKDRYGVEPASGLRMGYFLNATWYAYEPPREKVSGPEALRAMLDGRVVEWADEDASYQVRYRMSKPVFEYRNELGRWGRCNDRMSSWIYHEYYIVEEGEDD